MNAHFEFNEELHRLLLELDSTDEVYQPEQFNGEELLRRILAVKPCLEKALGVQLDLDDTTQDATYYYFLAHPAAFMTKAGIDHGYDFQAIFSNFGDLVLVGSSVPSMDISRASFESIANCLRANGFVAVSEKSVFGTKYDGHLPGFRKANLSWGSRFFDYI